MDQKYYFDTLNSLLKEKEETINRLSDENLRLLNERNSVMKKYKKVIKSRGWKIFSHLRRLRKKVITSQKSKSDVHPSALYEENIDFSGYTTDIKSIALYLPAFHRDKHYDEWWGEGFTEWDNVRKGKPLFSGHNQPRQPHDDIGYYDLSDIEIIKKQVKLAKEHGIYGFGIYYYWFSGNRVLEKPLDLLIEHKEIEFPFMLVWANENWSRNWDGGFNDVLMEQKYAQEDPEKFIGDVAHVLMDKRYIRVDGKPLIAVYNPDDITDLSSTIDTWRKTAEREGVGELFILVRNTDRYKESAYKKIFDGKYEFPPRDKYPKGEKKFGDNSTFSYSKMIQGSRAASLTSVEQWPVMKGITLEWDNSPRRKENAFIVRDYSKELLYLWNRINIAALRKNNKPEHRLLFINAWNEWGDGTYLEPDKKSGYANINTISKSLFDIPLEENHSDGIKRIGCGINDENRARLNNYFSENGVRIAVQAHVFYLDLLPQVVEVTNNIPVQFDLYITICNIEDINFVEQYALTYSKASNIIVEHVDNKGRDIAPLLKQITKRLGKYEFICHIHTKKSKHDVKGDIWRNYLFENLLGSRMSVEEILYSFISNKQVGIIFPETIDIIRKHMKWGKNYDIAVKLCEKMEIPDSVLPKGEPLFPAGNMFWFRASAVHNIFECDCTQDIPEEEGQIDGTIMHAIERLWVYVAKWNGYDSMQVRNLLDNRPIK